MLRLWILALALMSGALFTFAHRAGAIQIYPSIPFCDFHSERYYADEIVYVCGEWDEYDFPCPKGDVYISANDGHFYVKGEALYDQLGGKNAVQGCGGGGAFFDAIIALPPLAPGRYDIVMDENQDGFFSEGEYPDYVLGDGQSWAFEAVDQTLGTGIDPSEIKEAAYHQAATWAVSGFAFRRVTSWAIDRAVSLGDDDQGQGMRRRESDRELGYDALFHTVRRTPILNDIAYCASSITGILRPSRRISSFTSIPGTTSRTISASGPT